MESFPKEKRRKTYSSYKLNIQVYMFIFPNAFFFFAIMIILWRDPWGLRTSAFTQSPMPDPYYCDFFFFLKVG